MYYLCRSCTGVLGLPMAHSASPPPVDRACCARCGVWEDVD